MSESTHITRREFLTRSGKAAGLAALATGTGFLLHSPERHPFVAHTSAVTVRDLRMHGVTPSLVIVRGKSPALNCHAALDQLGGMKSFVGKGESVLIKPNIGWDRMPEQAANTNPDVVRCLVRECIAAGAARVIVTDVSCNDPQRCFQRSGIARAAEEAGAEVEIPRASLYVSTNMGGNMLGEQLVYQRYLEIDKCINVPIAKHHSLTGATLGMKNLYGILGGNRSRLHQDIHNSIADLATFLRPTLTVMDAHRVVMRNGPQGGNLTDVKQWEILAASVDPVAIDAFAGETFFSLSAEQLPYLALCEKRGLGTAKYRTLPIHELST